jgi:hypothetical protein
MELFLRFLSINLLVLTAIIAAFWIEGADSQQQGLVCSVTTFDDEVQFDIADGDPFPTDLYASTPCGVREEWPCFCDAAGELEDDFIMCPYCGWEDINQDIICARDNGRVEYINAEGQRLSCPCLYGGNGFNLAEEPCEILSEETASTVPSTAAPVTVAPPTNAPTTSPPDSSPPTTNVDDACGAYFDECIQSSDCCSSRCVTNLCRKRIPPNKAKLSTGRGGSGNVVKASSAGGRRRTLVRSSSVRGGAEYE